MKKAYELQKQIEDLEKDLYPQFRWYHRSKVAGFMLQSTTNAHRHFGEIHTRKLWKLGLYIGDSSTESCVHNASSHKFTEDEIRLLVLKKH